MKMYVNKKFDAFRKILMKKCEKEYSFENISQFKLNQIILKTLTNITMNSNITANNLTFYKHGLYSRQIYG